MNYDATCVNLVDRATRIEGTIAIYRTAGSLVPFLRSECTRENA